MKLKFSLICAAVLAVSGCSKSPEEKAKEAAIEHLKNGLDDPASFEFVKWGVEKAEVRLKYGEHVENIRKQYESRIHDVVCNGTKRQMALLEDTITTYIYLQNFRYDVTINDTISPVESRQLDILNAVKQSKFGLMTYDIAEQYIDTAVVDTISKYQIIEYRAKNKNGALQLFKDSLNWRKYITNK